MHRAGDVVICDVDWTIGTDASSPMAIDYFERMGGTALEHPNRVVFSFDHYSPPTTPTTRGFHDRVRRFIATHGGRLYDVGEGLTFRSSSSGETFFPGSWLWERTAIP